MGVSSSYLGALLSLPVKSAVRHSTPVLLTNSPVSQAVNVMIRDNVGAVIALENGRPVGILTEKDILSRVIKAEKDLDLIQIREVMSQPIISIGSEKTIKEALDLIRDKNIRRLVVTEGDELLGLTTERRLLETAHERYMLRNVDRVKRVISEKVAKPSIAFISTYPPRECGIATYTSDLVDAISRLYVLNPPVITAINDRGSYYDYPSTVRYQIERDEVESYSKIAKKLNQSEVNVINLQHEFGLFGGIWGEYILNLLGELEKPVVTTLHTVLQDPPKDAERVLEEIIKYSDKVTVMARIGIKICEELYATFPDKVRYVPHGCPNVPLISSDTVKKSLDLQDRVMLSTFGLISRGKGIEYAIKAIPEIIEYVPRVLYLVIGETHPEVRKQEGESYRHSLIELVESLGITENVRFVNRFLSKSELIRFLQATDVYILPYPNREQISSGTLLYALSTGKAIVSTPFLHAEEVISEGGVRGCEFRDPSSIAAMVLELLQNENIKNNYQKRAYQYSRDMIWPNVGMKFVNLFYETLDL